MTLEESKITIFQVKDQSVAGLNLNGRLQSRCIGPPRPNPSHHHPFVMGPRQTGKSDPAQPSPSRVQHSTRRRALQAQPSAPGPWSSKGCHQSCQDESSNVQISPSGAQKSISARLSLSGLTSHLVLGLESLGFPSRVSLFNSNPTSKKGSISTEIWLRISAS